MPHSATFTGKGRIIVQETPPLGESLIILPPSIHFLNIQSDLPSAEQEVMATKSLIERSPQNRLFALSLFVRPSDATRNFDEWPFL